MNSREFYKHHFLADNTVYDLNIELAKVIHSYHPKKVFEFGCGQGKNLLIQQEMDKDIEILYGLDINEQAVELARKHGLKYVQKGDETDLQYVGGFYDVAFTCSVLNHIPEVDEIITQLKRIAPVVILMETQTRLEKITWFRHDYASFGFKMLDKSYQSPVLPIVYDIWVFTR
jgi:2-polyprenyl-3-methyl-5-hydroxy-6-metoxy-1,4-benzoquinol methylase